MLVSGPAKNNNKKQGEKRMTEVLANIVTGIIAGSMMLTAITLLSGLIIGISGWIFGLKM